MVCVLPDYCLYGRLCERGFDFRRESWPSCQRVHVRVDDVRGVVRIFDERVDGVVRLFGPLPADDRTILDDMIADARPVQADDVVDFVSELAVLREVRCSIVWCVRDLESINVKAVCESKSGWKVELVCSKSVCGVDPE